MSATRIEPMAAWAFAALAALTVAVTSGPKPSAAAQDDLDAHLEAELRLMLEESRPLTATASVWIGTERAFETSLTAGESTLQASIDRPRSATWALEPLCALALLRMADADRLSLSDPITKHLPALELGGATVTVEQVLTHSSGAPSFVDYVATVAEEQDAAGVLAWLGKQPLDAEAGSCFTRSESNALIACELAAVLGKKPLAAVLREWVIEPAGLEGTEIVVRAAKSAREASQSQGQPSPRAATLAELLGVTRLTTTAADLARLFRGIETDALLDGDARTKLVRADRLPGGIEAPYAFGFARTRLDLEPYLWLGGRDDDGAIHVAWHPEHRLTVALALEGRRVDASRIAERLAGVVLEIPEREIVDLPMTAEQRAIFVGVYYMGCTRSTIEERDEQLYFQTPYQGPHRLRFQGVHRFIAADDDELRLDFTLEDGRATEFVLIHQGARTGARRME